MNKVRNRQYQKFEIEQVFRNKDEAYARLGLSKNTIKKTNKSNCSICKRASCHPMVNRYMACTNLCCPNINETNKYCFRLNTCCKTLVCSFSISSEHKKIRDRLSAGTSAQLTRDTNSISMSFQCYDFLFSYTCLNCFSWS